MLNKIENILKKISRINSLTSCLLGDNNVFFRKHHLDLEKKKNFEQTFISSISWLYALYNETAGKNLDFIESKINKSYEHTELIHALRTYYQHALNPNSKSDRNHINFVEEFFYKVTGKKRYPKNEKEWQDCCDELYDEALEFLGAIVRSIQNIKNDEHRDLIVEDWKNHKQEILNYEEVKRIFKKVSKNLGLEYYDADYLCTSNYKSWMSQLKAFKSSTKEERKKALFKIIENELLRNDHLPIDGDDIMDTFNIDEGLEVKEKLDRARKLFDEDPCGKSELLKRLKT